MRLSLAVLYFLTILGCVEKDNVDTKDNPKASAKTIQVNPLPDSELVQYQACQSPSDCIYVNNGCCDCANSGNTADGNIVKSGQEIAINASKKTEFEARFSCKEEKFACTERARMPMCGSGKVTCEKNLCTYKL